MSQIARHPDETSLMGYAAGALAEPLAAVVAAHAAVCPRCRSEIAALREVGGLLLDALPTDSRASPLAPIEVPPRAGAASAPARSAAPVGPSAWPAPLSARYGLSLDAVPWKQLGPGIRQHRLLLSPGAKGDLRLLRVEPGRAIPEHGHGGAEMTLVLQGAYRDLTGTYRRGDVQDVDGETEHRPVAEASDACICLVASEAPPHLKGVMARFVEAWLRR